MKSRDFATAGCPLDVTVDDPVAVEAVQPHGNVQSHTQPLPAAACACVSHMLGAHCSQPWAADTCNTLSRCSKEDGGLPGQLLGSWCCCQLQAFVALINRKTCRCPYTVTHVQRMLPCQAQPAQHSHLAPQRSAARCFSQPRAQYRSLCRSSRTMYTCCCPR